MEEIGQDLEKFLRQQASAIMQLIQSLRQHQQQLEQRDRNQRIDHERAARNQRIDADRHYQNQRRAAHDLFQVTRDTGWWRRASAEEIAEAYGTARAWAEHGDRVAINAHNRLAEQIQQRWNIDARALTAPELAATRHHDLTASQHDSTVAESPTSDATAAIGDERVESGPATGREDKDQGPHDAEPIADPAPEPPYDPSYEPAYDTETGEILDSTGEQAPAAHDQVDAGAAVEATGYARARASELEHLPEDAREARLGSAKSFPSSLKAALGAVRRTGHTNAKKTAEPITQDRSHEQGL